MKYCDIIRDLFPLYVDELTSEESNQLIREHLAQCTECQAYADRMQLNVSAAQATENADYKKALQRQKRKTTKKHLLIAGIALILGIALCTAFLWSRGYFNIIERQTSPDGTIAATVYSGEFSDIGPTGSGFTIKESGSLKSFLYFDAAFHGMWWSPDSRYLVISYKSDQWSDLLLVDHSYSSSTNLSAIWKSAMNSHQVFSAVPYDEYGDPIIEYNFIQWSEHDNTMLISYSFTDVAQTEHKGYFWYHCETQEVFGVWEIPA